jgi:hypothetical protein
MTRRLARIGLFRLLTATLVLAAQPVWAAAGAGKAEVSQRPGPGFRRAVRLAIAGGVLMLASLAESHVWRDLAEQHPSLRNPIGAKTMAQYLIGAGAMGSASSAPPNAGRAWRQYPWLTSANGIRAGQHRGRAPTPPARWPTGS